MGEGRERVAAEPEVCRSDPHAALHTSLQRGKRRFWGAETESLIKLPGSHTEESVEIEGDLGTGFGKENEND